MIQNTNYRVGHEIYAHYENTYKKILLDNSVRYSQDKEYLCNVILMEAELLILEFLIDIGESFNLSKVEWEVRGV